MVVIVQEKKNEKLFYEKLQNILVGNEISGKGGFVKILGAKNKYYEEILSLFKSEVDNDPIIISSFKEEFYEKLYNFFGRYFSQSGSIYFNKTQNFQKIYEQVYTNNQDVILFWKTNMLYYVKSDVIYNDVELVVDWEDNNYKFFIDTSQLENKMSTTKKKIIYDYEGIIEKNGSQYYHFTAKYSTHGRITKIDDINKDTSIPSEVLEKAFHNFEQQSTVDFFINKDAKRFLNEQLNLYVNDLLTNIENKFDQERLEQIKKIKEYAIKIIDAVSQFEDELVRIWNKPKFIKNSNYVISSDMMEERDIENIIDSPNMAQQTEEWVDLGIVEEDIEITTAYLKNNTLPVDTKYFKEYETNILESIDDIDKALNGRLYYSENYQALNSIKKKYRGRVRTIYIDPPFNTGSDFFYVDKYQDSSWLTMLNDRLKISIEMLSNKGSLFTHFDEKSNYMARMLLDQIVGSENFRREIIWDTQVLSGYKTLTNNFILGHQSLYYYVKNINNFYFEKQKQPHRKEYLERFDKEDENGRKYFDGRGERRYLDEVIEEGKAVGDVWYDIMSFQQNSTSKEKVPNSSELTQKPEALLERIIKSTSEPDNIILDFFLGSGTSVSAAHKTNRKWIGIDMGDHLINTVIPRMKEVISSKTHREPCGISEENNWKGGGFFKYSEVEQYEETLENAIYDNESISIFNANNPYNQYVFLADNKFTDVLKIDSDNTELNFDFVYENIDWPETLSNLYGLPIKKISSNKVVLDNNSEDLEINFDFNNMSSDEKIDFTQRIKSLIWWGD